MVLFAWIGGDLTACRDSGPPTNTETSLIQRAEFIGCEDIALGSTCLLNSTPNSQTLKVWIQVPANAIVEVAEGGRLEGTWTRVSGGYRGVVEVLPDAGEISIVANIGHQFDTWRLPIERLRSSATYTKIKKLITQGRFDAIDNTASDLTQREKILIEVAKARDAHRKGDYGSALDFRRRAMEFASGLPSQQITQMTAMAHILLFGQRDLVGAREVLERAESLASTPKGEMYVRNYQGLLAREEGDFHGALRAFTEMGEIIERLSLSGTAPWWSHMQAVASVLVQVGRSEEALALMEQARTQTQGQPLKLSNESQVCQEAWLLQNYGWFALVAQESGYSAPVSPLDSLNQALEHYSTPSPTGCSKPSVVANLHVNLALAHIQQGNAGQAQQHLDTIQKLTPNPRPFVALWALDLQGRVHLLEKRAKKALRTYGKLAGLAERAASEDAAWRADLGRARALVQLKRAEDAVQAYRSSEERLSEQSYSIALGEGRGDFIAVRDQSARELVGLLVDLKRYKEAIYAARKARTRLVSGLHQESRLPQLADEERRLWETRVGAVRKAREALDKEVETSWSLSQSEYDERASIRKELKDRLQESLEDAFKILAHGSSTQEPAAPKDSILIGFHPTTHGEWIGFVETENKARVVRLAPFGEHPSPEEWSRILLKPFEAELENAKRIRILPYGRLTQVDVHALPWRQGEPLSASHVVMYALDVDVPSPKTDSTTTPTALVVADPRGDLPSARDEGSQVSRLLQKKGWSVVELQGTQATGQRFRESFLKVSLVHYAGHAEYIGTGLWNSALPLANDVRLTLGDILALPTGPSAVILSGCETGRADTTAIERLGLAQGFVLVGARNVIAATRRISDEDALRFGTALHANFNELRDWPKALAYTQRQLLSVSPDADWMAFRILVP